MTVKRFPQPLSITYPDWLNQLVVPGEVLNTDLDRMELAIKLSQCQVDYDTGGPFGAIVCNLETGEVVGVGVNRVVPNNASVAHAEVVAWSCAQQYFANYDLGASNLPPLGLYSSAQPCVACWGGLFWTGLRKLVCGATKVDVESLTGFNEGPVPPDWAALLKQAGIDVVEQVSRSRACEVLKRYAQRGVIYNPSK